jgi:hypothetical protein
MPSSMGRRDISQCDKAKQYEKERREKGGKMRKKNEGGGKIG